MNNFHPENFIPDPDYETLLPWHQVMKFLNIRKKSRDYAGKKACPKCGLSSERLVWIGYSTPDIEWATMVGHEGYLSLCPDCSIQVEYIMTYHNW